MESGERQFAAPRCLTRAPAPALWVEVMAERVFAATVVAEMRYKKLSAMSFTFISQA